LFCYFTTLSIVSFFNIYFVSRSVPNEGTNNNATFRAEAGVLHCVPLAETSFILFGKCAFEVTRSSLQPPSFILENSSSTVWLAVCLEHHQLLIYRAAGRARIFNSIYVFYGRSHHTERLSILCCVFPANKHARILRIKAKEYR
jgi:hypothetical protein